MTQELVKELFEYKDGHLYWKVSKGSIKAGKIAGTNHNLGYRRIEINAKRYLEHRLIWLYHNGMFPLNQIDHINNITDDNRIENLREATNGQNGANRKKRAGLSSKYKGVNWNKAYKKWVAQISIDGNMKGLGCFHEESAAAQAYNEAAIKHFGEFALINKI